MFQPGSLNLNGEGEEILRLKNQPLSQLWIYSQLGRLLSDAWVDCGSWNEKSGPQEP